MLSMLATKTWLPVTAHVSVPSRWVIMRGASNDLCADFPIGRSFASPRSQKRPISADRTSSSFLPRSCGSLCHTVSSRGGTPSWLRGPRLSTRRLSDGGSRHRDKVYSCTMHNAGYYDRVAPPLLPRISNSLYNAAASRYRLKCSVKSMTSTTSSSRRSNPGEAKSWRTKRQN
jgi:hypothetical protein